MKSQNSKIQNQATIGAVFLLLSGASSFAATTGSLTLSGVVAQQTAIVVAAAPGASTLDLSTTATDLNVATVTEKNNTNLGYKVTLSSVNAGNLKNGTLGQLAYTAKYNGTSVTLSSTPVNVTTSPVSNAVVNISKPFTISYTGVAPAGLMAGTYSDTLTFTITSP